MCDRRSHFSTKMSPHEHDNSNIRNYALTEGSLRPSRQILYCKHTILQPNGQMLRVPNLQDCTASVVLAQMRIVFLD